MRFFLNFTLVLFSFVSQYCSSQNKKEKAENTVSKLENDTLCFSNNSQFNNNNFVLLKACSVIYSDSLSLKFQNLLAKGSLKPEYNFQGPLTQENFTKSGDTLTIKWIYITWIRGTEIKPLRFVSFKDSLHIFETIKRFSDAPSADSPKVEEFYYKFIIKNAMSDFVIRRFTTNLSPNIGYKKF